MRPDEALERLRRLGFGEADAQTLFAHFDDAERRGKFGHGYSRIDWLETLPDLRPGARPERLAAELGVPLLAEVPLDPRLREQGDAGEPLVAADPDAPSARAILELAERISATRRERGVGIVKQLPVVA